MTIALYPGGFDPLTNGHLDIVQRAASMFDEVVMAIYPRSSETFDVDERLAMIEGATKHCPNVRAAQFTGLVVNFADEVGASVLVRGIRAVTGFEPEFDMALMKQKDCAAYRVGLPHVRPSTPLHLSQPNPGACLPETSSR